jgi:hypothetical protein
MSEPKEQKKPHYHFLGTTLHNEKVVARMIDETQMASGVTVDSLRSAARVGGFNFHALKGLHLMDADVLKIKHAEALATGHKHNAAQLDRAGQMVMRKAEMARSQSPQPPQAARA